jgi:hypothetical protein
MGLENQLLKKFENSAGAEEKKDSETKIAYLSKLYSGSHAKIPLPTANSIVP